MKRYIVPFFTLLLGDVISKIIVQARFPGEFVINKGISWSIFHSTNPLVAGIVAGAVGAFVALFAWYTYAQIRQNLPALGEVLVLAGACGNLLDRLVYGGVIDFIVIGCCGYTWPFFNVADVVIVAGVMLMMVRLPWR